jgi:hypothetical protein
MTDFTVFEDRPDRDDAPAACQYEGCDDVPTHYVLYRTPKEYVCYCQMHAGERKEVANGKILKRLPGSTP